MKVTIAFAAIIAGIASHSPGQVAAPAPTPLQPTTAATRPAVKVPDLCRGPIDPYDKGKERTRFFVAAAVDGELDANEFTADSARPKGFVRKFDRWATMLRYDKNANKTVNWSEAEAYRDALRQKVFAAFDANKDGKLKGPERDAANRALAAGRISTATSRPSGRGRRWGRGMSQEILSRYDTDGDGQLSAEERRAAWGGMRSDWRTRMLDQYDTDGDGEISPDEANAAREQWREQRRRSRIERYDTDGDGELDDDERRAMEQQRPRRAGPWGGMMREWQLRVFDDDGDGELSDEERSDSQEFSRKIGQVFRDLATRSTDADGDGNVSPEERRAAGMTWMRVGFVMMARMRGRMDSDRDGEVTDEEREAFQERTSAGTQRWVNDFADEYELDGDGKFSAAEREAMIDGFRKDMDTRYKDADADEDGRLDANETLELLEKFSRDLGMSGRRPRGMRGGRRGGMRGGRWRRGRPTSRPAPQE